VTAAKKRPAFSSLVVGAKHVVHSEHPTPVSDPARTGLEQAGDGRMWLESRFRSELATAGLTGFDAVMLSARGQCLRVLRDRENWRLELPDGSRASRGVYLKKHHVRTWRSRLRATFGAGPGETAGRVEARNSRRLAADGIACMDLVAYGETLKPDGRLESFVLTEELAGFLPLDDFLKERFPASRPHRVARRDRDLDRLIHQVAAVARKLHDAGYNHRDLYCCHFFVREPAGGRFEIKLIDLQRVQHRRRRRRRWLVKDLAQLAYSAPRDRITCTRRLAFMRRYLGVGKLCPGDKRLIRAVLAKKRRMERRRGPAA
jgi:heptose I phosphotransferase